MRTGARACVGGREWGAVGAQACEAGGGRHAGRGAQARGARGVQVRGRQAWALGARAGQGCALGALRLVFNPVFRLGIFPESLNEHCSL